MEKTQGEVTRTFRFSTSPFLFIKTRRKKEMRKNIVGGILISIGLFFATHAAQAITYVSGNQTGTWALAGSPYVVIGTVTVPYGSNLMINQGVIVKFATNTSLIAYGSLTAVGTPDGKV